MQPDSTWHMVLVFFGFRYEGPLPEDHDRSVIRLRRITAAGAMLMIAGLLLAALL